MAGGDETLKQDGAESASSEGSRSRTGALRDLLSMGVDELSPRYELRSKLGRGGMGHVIEAFDRRLRREVAIKVLRFADPDDADVARFVREAQISSRLDHPHVLPVHDLGVGPDGTVFFSMKRLRGHTLTELLRTDPPTLHRRLDIFLKVCDAVAYAHHRGVLHRDIKPSNIMIGEFREVWVLDWGLAKQIGDDEVTSAVSLSDDATAAAADPDLDPLTTGGSVLGTPGFLSPEQARGEHATLDVRTDVFSLGVLLYLLLCDGLPFEGRGRVAIENVAKGVFDPPRKRRRDVSWELESVVLRAMAHRPEDRFPSVEVLRGEVQRWVEGQPLATVHYSLPRRAAKFLWRHRKGAAALGVTTFVASTVGLVGLVVWLWAVLSARDRALAAEQEARLALARSDVRLARAEADLGRLPDAIERLELAQSRLSALGADTREAGIVRSWLAGRFAPPELTVTGTILRGRLSADGDRLAVVPENGPLRVLAVPTGETLVSGIAVAEGDRALAVELDGDRLTTVVLHGGVLEVRDGIDGHRVAGPFVVPDGAQPPTVWLTGGNVVATGADIGTFAWRVADGQPLGPPIPGALVQGVSEDGTAAVGHDRGTSQHRSADTTVVWDLRTGEERFRRPAALGAELSSDGWRLVVDEGGRVGVRSIDGAELWSGDGLPGARLGFVDADRRLVVVGSDDRFRLHDASSGAVLGERRILGGPNASQGKVGWAAGGRRFFVAHDGVIRVWSIEPGDDRPWLAASERNLTALELSPDGLLLATGGWDGHLRLWDWRSRSLLRDVAVSESGVRDVAFSADGALLLTAARDGVGRLVDTATGRAVHELRLPDANLAMGATFVNGDPTVLFEDGRVGVFDPATGEPRFVMQGAIHNPWSVAASPDGARLLVVGRSRTEPVMELWDVVRRERVRVGPLKGAGYRGAFSPDGSRVVVGTHEGLVLVFDGDAEPRVLHLRDEALQSIGFSSDGTQLAVGAYDGQLDLYDAATLESIQSLPVHDRSIVDLAFVPGAHVVLTASGDGRVAWLDQGRWEALEASSRTWSPDAPPDAPDGDGWVALARGATLRANWEGVLRALDRAEDLGTPVPAVERARAAWALGRVEEARAALDDALESDDRPTLRAWRNATQ